MIITIGIVIVILIIVSIIIWYIFRNPCYSNSSLDGTGPPTNIKKCKCLDNTYYPDASGVCNKCDSGQTTDGYGQKVTQFCKCASPTQFYNADTFKCETCPTGLWYNGTAVMSGVWDNACTCHDPKMISGEGPPIMSSPRCRCPLSTQWFNMDTRECEPCPAGTHYTDTGGYIRNNKFWGVCNCDDPKQHWSESDYKCIF